MFKLVKFLAVAAVLGGGYFGYAFWGELTPGEKHHLKDHAKKAIREGEFNDVGQVLSNKIKDKAQTQKSRLEEKGAAVKKELQKAVHEKAKQIAEDTKEETPDPAAP